MILQCPIKVGTRVNGWHHTLKNLDDFMRCLYQIFGEHKLDYSFLGLIGHNGIDIELENGDEIFASHDGEAEYQQDYLKGLGIVITTQGYKTIYWHLKDAVKPLGSKWQVKMGDLIGWGDNTGFSTGPHLHYGLKLLDSNGEVLNRDNGYDGAVDPLPYLAWWNSMRFVKVGDDGVDVWLINNDRRSLVYNALAFQLINGNWAQIEIVTQEQLNAFPDTGAVIVGAQQN